MDVGLDIYGTLHGLLGRAMAAVPGARRGCILFCEGDQLVYGAAVGMDELSSHPLHIPSKAGLAREAQFLHPEDEEANPRFVPASTWHRSFLPALIDAPQAFVEGAAMLVQPVRASGEPCGAIALELPAMELPVAGCLSTLELLADRAGAALERRKLYAEKARAAQEVRLFESVLQSIEASINTHDLIHTIADGVKGILTHPHWSAIDLCMVDEPAGGAPPELTVYRSARVPITRYWNNVRDGALAAGREIGADVDFRVPAREDGSDQVALLEDGIRRRVDGIVLAPMSPAAIEPSIRRAVESGIPVITIDTPPVSGSSAHFYIGTDNAAAGSLAGQVMRRLLPGGGVTAVQVSSLRIANGRQRVDGFCAGVAGPGISVLPPHENFFDADAGQRLAASVLASHPEVVGAFGACSENGPSWGAAARGAGRAQSLKIVAFDLVASTIAMLRDGTIHVIIAQREYDMGRRAVETLHEMIMRGVEPTLAKLPPSRVLDTGVDLVTLERTPWSSALCDYLEGEAARRSADRRAARRPAAKRPIELLVIGMSGKGEPVAEERVLLSERPLVARAIETALPCSQSPLHDTSAAEGAAASDSTRARSTVALVAVPLVAQGAAFGALVVSGEARGRGEGAAECTAEDLSLLERISGTVAVAIQNARLFQGYRERTKALERANEEQASLLRTINELSSPVVPIAPGVLVIPLIGTMEAERSSRFIEAMLREIHTRGASVVLVDATGLAVADAAAARHLAEAARAASLLGAEVVLVGLSPPGARMMVQQGVEIGYMVTRPNLELGFAYALAKTNGRIVYNR